MGHNFPLPHMQHLYTDMTNILADLRWRTATAKRRQHMML